ncbi:MAG TPA: hypothetical protein VET46_11535, partial [Steroidobacteraceae bacterium]|nr:hypothetical protein [Steroidobacteraceae bacterium]
AGLAVVLNQLRPIFLSRSLLGAVTGLPVLGSVSFVPQGRQDREPLLVGVASGVLLAVYGVVLLTASHLNSAIRMFFG